MGVNIHVYKNMEEGAIRHIPAETAQRLAQFFAVPVSDFQDEFDQFLSDGQAVRIRAYREALGMSRKAFAQYAGIPLTSLRSWEDNRKAISRKCWEQYFKGRA